MFSTLAKELVETALRVLVAWNSAERPASADLNTLRVAFPYAAHLPDDELACRAIHELSGIAFRETDEDLNAAELVDEVA